MDIRALDFYPPGFVDAIKNPQQLSVGKVSVKPDSLGDIDTVVEVLHNTDKSSGNETLKLSKHFTDSLYLSFEFNGVELSENSNTTTDVLRDTLDGRQLFRMNCARCHYPSDQKMIGPGLKGVRGRWKSEKDLYAFIRDPKSFLQTGDKYANDLFLANSQSLPPSFDLTDEEIAVILQYIEMEENGDGRSRIGYNQGIRPSKVLTFWQSSFNQTFLATKEFESRMPLIHQTCNNAILDLYINNLDKKLYEVDSMAAQIAGGLAPEFLKFAAMKHGRIENGDKKYDMLQKFYQRQAFVMAQAAIKTTQTFYAKNKQADLEAIRRGNNFATSEGQRSDQLFMEEYNLNLKTAYKDLGYKPVRIQPGFTAIITTPGWKNVDRLVMESLIARTTFDYTDTLTGRRSVIEYKEMIANVSNAGEFDLVNVYLVPDKLTTYMKVNGSLGKYTEKLNMTIKYDLIVIGYKHSQAYFQSQSDISPDVYSFTLTDNDIKPIEALLAKLSGNRNTESLKMAVNYSMFKIADDERRTKYERIVADRERLRPIVFPCSMQSPNDTLSTDSLTVTNG